MSLLQFISSIISSFSWPSVIVFVALLLRKPLSQIILSLHKISYKDLQADFGQEVTKLEEQADRANLPAIEWEERDSGEIVV